MRQVITLQDVPETGEMKVPIGTLVTPSARDLAASRGVKIVELPEDQLRGLDVTRTLISGIWSRSGKVSPHANIGYEFWSSSVPVSSDGSVYGQTGPSLPNAAWGRQR